MKVFPHPFFQHDQFVLIGIVWKVYEERNLVGFFKKSNRLPSCRTWHHQQDADSVLVKAVGFQSAPSSLAGYVPVLSLLEILAETLTTQGTPLSLPTTNNNNTKTNPKPNQVKFQAFHLYLEMKSITWYFLLWIMLFFHLLSQSIVEMLPGLFACALLLQHLYNVVQLLNGSSSSLEWLKYFKYKSRLF